MRRHVRPTENVVLPSRFLWAHMVVLAISGILLIRLWYVQIYAGDHYRKLSEMNRTRYIEIPAPRGVIYDRQGNVVLGNRPYFDLVYIPQYVKDKDKTFDILARLLHTSVSTFERRLRQGQGLQKFYPITLKRNLSLHEVAVVQSNRIFLPGIEILEQPRRDYKADTPPHMVGYLGEISRKALKSSNKENTENPYRLGDLIGKQGLELRWEKYLRGQRGNRLIQVDAFGRQTDFSLAKGVGVDEISLPHKPAIPGSDLILTLDFDLQKVVREAFTGKKGAVVVLNAKNGAILSMLSEPGYEPNIFQGGLSYDKYRSLRANPFAPFLDKTTGGKYAPGSIYKAIVAVAALEENIVTPWTKFHCSGSFTIGRDKFGCHNRAGHGWADLRKAMMKSCDVYFYNVGMELGIDRMARYARDFGLGSKLGIRINRELPGLIPTTAWKRLTFRYPWTQGETPPVSIGQGAVEMTPIQMATLYATIGNRGRVWRPHLVKKVVNHIGETILERDPELIRTVSLKSSTWKALIRSLEAVVMDDDGTGKLSRVEGIPVAGKTGTAQVVSLKKNITDFDVSVKWKDHAIFTAFAPIDNPEVAISVVSEFDGGHGGDSAAPIAGKILNAYWDLKRQRANIAKAEAKGASQQ